MSPLPMAARSGTYGLLLGGLLLCPAVSLSAAIVINEIMYHPPPDRARLEYVELYNRSGSPMDLSGWRLDQAVRYTFGPDTLEPNDYLVVTADLAAFRAVHPEVTAVVGKWEGRLSNRGERLVLRNSLGQIVDEVIYADEGDWATRVEGPLDFGHRGWIWESPADGKGHSLELGNPEAPNEFGQSWAASQVRGGTPGRSNSVFSDELPPLVLEVQHAPLLPRPTDTVFVTARVVAPLGGPLDQVTLHYRQDGSAPGGFLELPMFDDGQHGDGAAGDQVHGAAIPPQPDRTIIEFYVRAVDSAGRARSWPAPVRMSDGGHAQRANLLYQVSKGETGGHLPTYRLVLTAVEREQLARIGSTAPDHQSNAQLNATWISDHETSREVRYLVGVRHRGHGSRGLQPNNFRVNFRSDDLWNNADELNLNGQYSYLQHLGSVLGQMAGLPAATSHAAKVLLNDIDPSELGPVHLTYGCYAVNEVLNGDFIDRLFPDDRDGNLYRGRAADATNQEADFRYLGNTPAPYRAVYDKLTNRATDDWADLIALCYLLTETSDDPFASQLTNAIEIEGWLTHFAVMALLDNRETGLHTGFGDDFALYAGGHDRRFHLIPHDLDTILGQGNVAGATNAPFFLASRIPALDRLLKAPEIAPQYYAAVRRLMETLFAPQTFGSVADHALRPYVPLAVIDSLKHFAAARIAYLHSIIPNRLTLDLELGVSGGLRVTGGEALDLHGAADAQRTRGVRVNGALADWSAWEARWSAPNVTLQPGLNRLRVVAIDQQGSEIDETVAHVWRDPSRPTIVAPRIDRDTTWPPEAGPYLVPAGGLWIPPGITLTIHPGVSVVFESGATLRVAGRLVAEGTREQPIGFLNDPRMGGHWGGLQFEGPGGENRMRHCVIAGASGPQPQLQARNTSLHLEQCLWLDVAGPVIEAQDAALVVRGCDLTQAAGLPVIRATRIPLGGQVRIEASRFGPGQGTGPLIEIAGPAGRRPDPILELRDNVFLGGEGDGVVVQGVDAHLEGNLFRGFRNAASSDRHAVAVRIEGSGLTVLARNVWVDNEVAIRALGGAALSLEHNTITTSAVAAVHRGNPSHGVAPSGPILLEGNILWDNAADVTPWGLGLLGGELRVERGILSHPGGYPGFAQWVRDPRFLAPGTDLELRMDSPARGVGPAGLDLGAYVPAGAGTVRIDRETVPVTEARFAVYGPGIRGYRFRMMPEPFGQAESVHQPIHLRDLAEGTHTLEVEGQDSAGHWHPVRDPGGRITWRVEAEVGRVILNEVLAANRSIEVGSSSNPDLIELHNPGTLPVDLGGMSLTDNPQRPRKFVFPAGSILPPGGYLVLYADNASYPPGHHLGFALSRQGEGVYLFDAPARGGGLLDSVVFGPQLDDLSIGRDQTGQWTLTRPTFGAPNVPHPVSDGRDLRINEWFTASRVLPLDDFIELYNPASLPAAIGGFYLSDRPFAQPLRHRIADLSFVAAGGFAVFEADGRPERGPNHLNFRLSARGGQINLFDPTGREVDAVLYGPQCADVSEGRTPDGSGRIEVLRAVSPNRANPLPVAIMRSETVPLVTLNSRWRFHQRGVDLGHAWRTPDYDDSGLDWESGNGLFYANLLNLPGPISTPLTLRTPSQPTIYFRTLFVHEAAAITTSLSLQHVVDDGVAVYLNGEEVYRYNLPASPLNFGTYATTSIGTPTLVGPITVPAVHLRPGLNVLAAEVHQSGSQSDDLAFGLALDAHLTAAHPPGSGPGVAKSTEWEGLWLNQTTYWSPELGDIHLWGDVMVPHPHVLVLGPGTTVRLAPGVSMAALGGSIIAQGTAAAPVRLLPLKPDQPWGGVMVTGDTGSLKLRHTEVAYGSIQVLEGARGMLEDCHLRDYLHGHHPIVVSDAAAELHLARCLVQRFLELDLTRTPVLIEDCLLEFSYADAIDLDASPPSTEIRRTIIRHGLGENTDAIDFGSGSRGTVRDCLIYDFPDKGISVGERAQDVQIHNNLIYSTRTGIAVTESSTATIAHNTMVSCGTGLRLFEKSIGEGGGQVVAWNNLLWDHDQAIIVDRASALQLSFSLVQGGWTGLGEGVLDADPLFRDPVSQDYRLLPESPARAAGLGGVDLGVGWPVGGFPESPSGLEVVVIDTSSLLIRWVDRSRTELGFAVERAPLDGPWEVAGLVDPNQTLFLDQPTGSEPGYRYRVSALGRWGASFPSDTVVALLPLDSDGDGMPDEWEVAHGLDPHSPHDADLDPDGDGLSNLTEFLSGTDPRDPESALALVVARLEAHAVTLGFQVQPGRRYTVECAPALSEDAWIPCLELSPRPVAEWIHLEAPVVEAGQWFYRVRLQHP